MSQKVHRHRETVFLINQILGGWLGTVSALNYSIAAQTEEEAIAGCQQAIERSL